MGYWHSVQTAAGMGGQYHWVLLGVVMTTFVLGAVVPRARPRLRVALFLFVLSAIGMFACGWVVYRDMLDERATGYRWIHYGSQLCLAIGIVTISAVFFFRLLLPLVRLDLAPILRDTLLGLGYVLVALTLLARHGVDLTGIVATSAVVTAVIGFSLQDTLGNLMGGVALQVEQSIAVGDWVRIGDMEGLVREIRWRQTSIETRDWDTVVIPNSVLMKSQVTVLGRRTGQPVLHRMWVHFFVDFTHPPADVIDAVERALRAEVIPNVATTPAPDCMFTAFRESYADYAVRFWLSDLSQPDPTSTEVRTRIFVALQRAGMNPSIPSNNVYMTVESRSRDERIRKEESSRRAAALRGVAILRPLTDDERSELADKLTVAPFRRGEAICRQGVEAHHLYILIKGEVEVRVAAGKNGQEHRVRALGPGEVVGEMGLLTGEPRSATVWATTDVVCYRLAKDAFKDILQRRPEIAEAISRLVAERKMEVEHLAAGVAKREIEAEMRDASGELLEKIRRFFTLG